MPSPFPGMDSYLEAHWGDVHHRLITYACDQLQGGLPRDLRARVQARVFVESFPGSERSIYPDVRVIEGGARKRRPTQLNGALAMAEPLIILLPDEPITEGYIEIIEPEPPLAGDDARWADRLLREKGFRPRRKGRKRPKKPSS